MPQRVLLIVNPISGRRHQARRLELLRQAIAGAGFDLLRRETAGPGDATRLAAGVNGDLRAVLVAGGDGTVREAAAGLVNREVPIYHLPVGNENLFAKHFGMSGKPAEVVRSLQAMRMRRVDMMEVNGAAATSCVGVGFDAEIVRLVSRKRRGHVSDLSYVWPIVTTSFTYRFPELEVTADGKSVFSGQGMFFAGNLTRYAVGIPLFKRADDGDGLVDAVVFPCKGRLRLLKDFAITMMGRHYNHKSVIYLRARSLKVTAGATVASQVDGDAGPAAPIEINVRPGAMNVLLPAGEK